MSWIEHKISEAVERGEFDDLPGEGEPLDVLKEPYEPTWWVKRWVQRKLNSMRLTATEQEQWTRAIESRREKGMATLEVQRAQGRTNPAMRTCAFCDGARNACRFDN